MSESDVFMRTFDEPGDVCERDAGVIRVFDDADHWLERREGIGGDFGSGVA